MVTWRAAHLLAECLDSLLAQTYPCRVLVVDNASSDGTDRVLDRYRTRIEVLRLPANAGFAGGVSAAIPHVGTPLFALLNDDAVADPHWVERCVQQLTGEDNVAAVTAQIRLWDEESTSPERLNNAGVRLTSGGYGADRGFGCPIGRPFDEPADVFGFSGGAALLRIQTVREVGGVAARYFLYYEDTDLSWRLRLAGWRIRYEPTAVVWHRHAASSDVRSALFARCNERNRLLTLLRCAPAPFVITQLIRFCVTTGSLAVKRRLGRVPDDVPTFDWWLRIRVLAETLRAAPWALRERRAIGRRSSLRRADVMREWLGR